jgi:acyl-CoA thioester hydrolase
MTGVQNLSLDGEILNGQHRQPVRVYYEDTDFSGIVYHASYLRFMERGRTNYLRLIGADDVLTIVTTPKDVRGASVTLNQKVVRGEDLLVEADVQVAFISAGRARPIPKPLRIAMKADQETGSGSGPT